MSTNTLEYAREWRRNHPDNVARYRENYKAKHPGKDRNHYLSKQESLIEAARKYRRIHKEEIRARKLIKRYGESLDYNQLFVQQDGCCAICGRHQSELERTMCVDHDHKTGNVRGLLCTDCNLAIGLLGDNTEILNLAIEYLEAHHK